MAFAANDSDVPSLSSRFRHAETTVKGTEMGYCNFLPAEMGHWQPPQLANIDTTRRQRIVPFHS